MVATYKKGSRIERELITKFNTYGFSVIRAAGSGTSSLSPDLLVFKKGLQYAFEVKAHESEYLRIKKEQFLSLKEWQRNTSITSYIVWKRKRKEFLFIPLVAFDEHNTGFSITWKRACLIGRRFPDLVHNC